MLLRPKTRSNYAKWFGSGKTLNVLLEFRPRLDKWDVISLENKFQGLPRWYMHQKTERFATMLEAIKFILKLSNEDEIRRLNNISNQPVKLKKKIESLKESVQDLVKVADNR